MIWYVIATQCLAMNYVLVYLSNLVLFTIFRGIKNEN